MKNPFKFNFKKKSTARATAEERMSDLIKAERELIDSMTKTTEQFLKQFN